MSQTTNIGLLTIGIGLVSLGANSIALVLAQGSIEIILGILVLAFYEFTPTKTV